MFDEEAVRREFAEASDEELYDVLAHPESYVPEALEAARDVLRSRNLIPATAAALEAASSERKVAENASAVVRAALPLQWWLRVLMFLLSFGLPQLILAEVYLRPRGYERKAKES